MDSIKPVNTVINSLILGLLLFFFQSREGLSQKSIIIPAEWDERGIPYSMERSFQSENFILFWGEKAGNNPLTAPEEISFDPAEVAGILENIFDFYINEVQLIPPDHGNFALYKFIIVLNETWYPLQDGNEIFTGWAFGGNYDSKIGAMWIHPRATNSFTLAHEFTHCMQNMVWIDYPGHGFINNDYVGSFWETHANFIALQANPSMVENTDPARFLSTQHFYFSSARHHYTNWMLLQYLLDTEGMEFINRLWKESLIGEHPFETLKRLKGLNQDQLNDLICSYAMRTVVFDFSNGPEIRQTIQNEINKAYITRRFTVLKDISIINGRYIVPDHLAPQDYGYNIVSLCPDNGNESGEIDINFRIHDNSNAGGGGTRTAFVFVNAEGEVRYSEIYRNSFSTTLDIMPGEEELYMVVTGAPDIHHNYSWEPGFQKIYRFPWEIRLEGARPVAYTDEPNRDYKLVGGNYHPNGRGFVASTATVSSSAYVGTKAVVLDNAVVTANARIEGAAVIMNNAQVTDNSVVSGFAQVGGNAIIKDQALVRDYARVNHGAIIGGDAIIKGSAAVFNSSITGNALVMDNATLWGASLSGDIKVGGDAEQFRTCSSGTYLHIFNLANRGCDGSNDHELNIDINPEYAPFTDSEMGITGFEDTFESELPYIVKRNGSGRLYVEASEPLKGESINMISITDISGRILNLKRYRYGQTVIELELPETGIFILRIGIGNKVYFEKIVK